jgi:TonB-dependent starch-binding outer membrane protein SusC
MKIKAIFFILLSAFCFSSITAQKSNKKITITGTVLDASKRPIVNAIIMIDDVNTSAKTDQDGNYRIKVKPTASKIGIFTFGNGTKEEPLDGRTRIDFNFGTTSMQQVENQNNSSSEQGVNSGYGMVKKKNTTTDIHKIDGTDKKYASYTTIGEMIQREVAGVQVKGTSVVIQNAQDLFGDVPALIIVDGVYMDELPSISPSQVKSVEVLKGTAAAIYGSRGYGGAIIIKTKTQN